MDADDTEYFRSWIVGFGKDESSFVAARNKEAASHMSTNSKASTRLVDMTFQRTVRGLVTVRLQCVALSLFQSFVTSFQDLSALQAGSAIEICGSLTQRCDCEVCRV